MMAALGLLMVRPVLRRVGVVVMAAAAAVVIAAAVVVAVVAVMLEVDGDVTGVGLVSAAYVRA